MASTINHILELLSNGEWHSLAELLSSRVSHEDLNRIIRFLKTYDVVEVSDNMIKMTREFRKLGQ